MPGVWFPRLVASGLADGRVDMDGPWSWAGIDRVLFDQVHARLRNCETMTWSEIERAGSHFVDFDKLDKRARDRQVELRQDDVDQLFSLRVDGKLRLWGIREGAALRVMWFDPEHEVCPSLKKFT